MLNDKKLLLASHSPRRRELLKAIAPDVDIIEPDDVDETYPADLPLEEIPAYLSRLKADACTAPIHPGEIIVTADTIVICDGRVLGKPHSRDEAVEMLRLLSGNTHKVITGVTLTSCDKSVTFSDTTEVTFSALTDDEINHYVDVYKPFDKAGAYGIQEWIGYIGISGINGCYYNVMGLPLNSLYRELKNF